MKVRNIHKRIINKPKKVVVDAITTLSTENDKIWPKEKWPAMKFEDGIKIGAKGGHGSIRYLVERYNPSKIIQFRFEQPKEFSGIHKFEIREINDEKTEIRHTIDMKTSIKGSLMWFGGIRSLHNALLEDAFDKLENNFTYTQKVTPWNFWVKFLRKQIEKRNKNKTVK